MISSYVKAIAAILVLVALAATAAAGYSHGYGVAKTQGDLALQTLKARQQKAEADAARQADDAYTTQVNKGDAAEQQLIENQRLLTRQATAAKEQIDVVTRTYRKSPDVAPVAVPECVFTRGFIRLWNAAAGANDGSGALQASGATATSDATADSTAALDSGVSQADLLDWFLDYANRGRSIETQLNQVLDLQPAAAH